MSEHEEQVLLYDWASQMEAFVPELAFLFAVPNEFRSGWKQNKKGKRYNPTLTRMRREGLRAGALDNVLLVPRSGYHGMLIELKYGDNYLSEEQRAWCVFLIEQGYRVDVHYSFEAARDALCDYLGVKARFL